ncbi:MAG: TlpA family protein disulfide reductase, partial [Bacteroidales bacterium]|nr:TlpA family protein disulfide reductase [Bacteroidales bacterium]
MLEVGDQVPEFSVETSTGEVVSNRSLLGAVSCIVFFHTGCPDCQKTLPEMQRIYEEFSGRGVKFILISREQTREEIEPYWTDRGYTMPYSPQRTREIY